MKMIVYGYKQYLVLTCSVRARFASKKDLIVPISSQ